MESPIREFPHLVINIETIREEISMLKGTPIYSHYSSPNMYIPQRFVGRGSVNRVNRNQKSLNPKIR